MRIRIKPFAIAVALLVTCAFNIETVLSGMCKALDVCAHSIIPSLFVFMVLSNLTCSLLLDEDSISIPPKFLIWFLGVLCGFPIGATVCERMLVKGVISKNDAEKLLPFCNIASPAFVLGVIGVSMLNDKRLGFLLLFSQIISSFIPVLFLKVCTQKTENSPKKIKIFEAFTDSVEKSVKSVLNVCALICVFTVLLALIENTYFENMALILEISCGSALATSFYTSSPFLSIAMCGFCCGFSGICVHMQIFSVAKNVKPRYSKFFFKKVILGVFTAALSMMGYYLFF